MTLIASAALLLISGLFYAAHHAPSEKQDCRHVEPGEIATLNVGECAEMSAPLIDMSNEPLAPWKGRSW